MTKPYVYVAGPLFDEGERWFIEKVETLVAECGFVTFLPHRDNPPKVRDETSGPEILPHNAMRSAMRKAEQSLSNLLYDDKRSTALAAVIAAAITTAAVTNCMTIPIANPVNSSLNIQVRPSTSKGLFTGKFICMAMKIVNTMDKEIRIRRLTARIE